MNTPSNTSVTAKYAEQGRMLAYLGRYKEANNLLWLALKAQPTSAEVLCAMASLQFRLRNYSFALEYYRRAEECAPAMAEIYIGRALMHLELERLSLARLDIEKAQRILDNDFRINLLKAQYQLQMGQIEKARSETILALELKPNSEHALLMLGSIHERRGRWEDAIDIYGRILREVNPLSKEAYQRRELLMEKWDIAC